MSESCLIIGAGLAGLTAARVLAAHGIFVHVLDEGRHIGGRMATGSLQSGESTALFDLGAQFFTARSPEFSKAVADWMECGLVKEWFQGRTIATPDGTTIREPDGHTRFCVGGGSAGGSTADGSARGMDTIPDFIGRTLNVSLRKRVITVKFDKEWTVTTETGDSFNAHWLLLTAPVPQSLALLEDSGINLAMTLREDLGAIEYDPCLTAMLLFREPKLLPSPGALYAEGEPISWVADNHQKGLSPVPGSFTVHAAPRFSRTHWEAEPEVVVNTLCAAGAPWLDAPLETFAIHRWRYARPQQPREDGFLADPARHLIFAGDAFCGARVEGAYQSGLLAARYLLESKK